MTTSQLSVSLHILTLLAHADGEWVSSAYLAGSINVNPVLVRKAISILKNAGFISSREGKHGGVALAKPAGGIRLDEVYAAVQQGALLGGHKNEPNPLCPVGKQVDQRLATLYAGAEQALKTHLATQTLDDFASQFK